MKPTWNETWFNICKEFARRGSCLRLQTAAVIINERNRIIGAGYNGAPHGMPECISVGCLMEDNHCRRSIHSERNALLQAGEKAKGQTIYILHKPCIQCTNDIIQAEIAKVYYLNDYQSDKIEKDTVLELFTQAKIVCKKVNL